MKASLTIDLRLNRDEDVFMGDTDSLANDYFLVVDKQTWLTSSLTKSYLVMKLLEGLV
jgi:hypothetical protein